MQSGRYGGADLNAGERNLGGMTPLHLAASVGTASCMKSLLTFGANPDAKNGGKQLPLHFAKIYRHDSCAKMLRQAADSASNAGLN